MWRSVHGAEVNHNYVVKCITVCSTLSAITKLSHVFQTHSVVNVFPLPLYSRKLLKIGSVHQFIPWWCPSFSLRRGTSPGIPAAGGNAIEADYTIFLYLKFYNARASLCYTLYFIRSRLSNLFLSSLCHCSAVFVMIRINLHEWKYYLTVDLEWFPVSRNTARQMYRNPTTGVSVVPYLVPPSAFRTVGCPLAVNSITPGYMDWRSHLMQRWDTGVYGIDDWCTWSRALPFNITFITALT